MIRPVSTSPLRSSQNVKQIMQSALALGKQTCGRCVWVTRTLNCLARIPTQVHWEFASEHHGGRFASISTRLIQNNTSEIYDKLRQSPSFEIRRVSRNSKLGGRRSRGPECRMSGGVLTGSFFFRRNSGVIHSYVSVPRPRQVLKFCPYAIPFLHLHLHRTVPNQPFCLSEPDHFLITRRTPRKN